MFRSLITYNNQFTNIKRRFSTAYFLNRKKSLQEQSSTPCNNKENNHQTSNNSILLNNIQGTQRYSTSEIKVDVCSSRLSEPLEWSYVAVGGDKPLLGLTMGQVIDRAGDTYGDREAVVSMHQGIRKTFTDLQQDVSQV